MSCQLSNNRAIKFNGVFPLFDQCCIAKRVNFQVGHEILHYWAISPRIQTRKGIFLIVLKIVVNISQPNNQVYYMHVYRKDIKSRYIVRLEPDCFQNALITLEGAFVRNFAI